MIAEIGILLVLDIAVLVAKGGAALPATSSRRTRCCTAEGRWGSA